MKTNHTISVCLVLLMMLLSGFQAGMPQNFVITPQHFDKDFANEQIRMDVTYPEIRDLNDKVIYDLNYKINEIFLDSYNAFHAEVQAALGKQPEGYSYYILNYEICHQQNDLLSILFECKSNLYGAGQAKTFYQTVNFDIAQNDFVPLSGLFKSEYLPSFEPTVMCDFRQAPSEEDSPFAYSISAEGLVYYQEQYACVLPWEEVSPYLSEEMKNRIRF